MDTESMSQNTPSRPGSPAASHMLWFFIFPILALIVFATWKLSNSLLHPEVLTLQSRLTRLEKASNAGERWKEAYGVAQEIHKKKSRGEWQALPQEEKQAVYHTFSKVLSSNESDSRVARYLLVTLGQLGERESLGILQSLQGAKDPELVFYSVWAFSQSVISSKAWDLVSDDRSDRLLVLMKTGDIELRKIICAFLAQGPLTRPSERQALESMLDNAEADLRWSAAIALLPTNVAVEKSEKVLLNMMTLEELRRAQFRSPGDMKQALLAARSAIEKTKNQALAQRARALSAEVESSNPEGRNIKEALVGL